MTKLWGPMGWATLHSVAALYPDHPSQHEIQLAETWINCFSRSIVCPSCQGHFKKMYDTYRTSRPQIFSSRTEFVLFVLRAHNTVNRRLNKKVYTLDECWKILESWSQAYCTWQRRRYLDHIQRQWAAQVSMEGIVAMTFVRQLNTAESGYWGAKTLDWSAVRATFPSAYATAVVVPIVEHKPKQSPSDLSFNPIQALSAGQTHGFKFRTAKIPLSLISK